MNDLQHLMQCCETTRWHTVQMTRAQTLAEHQWCVTILALDMVNRYDKDHRPSAEDIVRCLIHDAHEVIDGDMPSNRDNPQEIAGKINRMNSIWEKCQKLADLLEAAHFSKNNAVTYLGKRKAMKCYDKFMMVCSLLDDRKLFGAANATHMDLSA